MLEAQLDVERSHLLSAMRGDRYTSMLSELADMEQRPPLDGADGDDDPDELLRATARSAWKALERSHRRATRGPSSERLHTLRKKVKRAHAVGQLAKEHGGGSKKFVRAADVLKDELGDLHDADVLIAWLDEVRSRLPVDAAYGAGQLRQLTVQRRVQLDASWVDAWDELDRARLRRWFD